MKRLNKKFWTSLVLFGLIGQIAWVVENMYLNVFIYKMFHASAANISMMVGASSVAATITTILIGALSDYIGKRKLFICGGYILWGISILGFGLIRMDVLTPMCESVVAAASLGISLVIVLDCVMTFLGSAANDAVYNAWLTDIGDDSNRGKIEGINAMMPLVSILVVFGGFMGFQLDLASSWTTIFVIIGSIVILAGIFGIFLIEEVPMTYKGDGTYLENVIYSFQVSTLKEHVLLYTVLGAFAVFGISINTFMPYLIVYYEKSLGMTDYVFVLAPAIILAAIITAWYGSLYDKMGFQKSILPSVGMLMLGYVILYFSVNKVPVFIGSLFMMSGYLTGMAVFGAMIRDNIPENMAGKFQGVRIIGQVLIPGMIGPSIGAFVLRNAEMIENSDGTFSFLPNKSIWAAAFITGLLVLITLAGIFHMVRSSHHKLWMDSKKNPDWSEYPRPQMKRDKYLILQDGWLLNGREIKMPFPPQSLLSGYGKPVGNNLCYETTFEVPKEFNREKVLLHFGAVDQIAEVYINGQHVASHIGGYLPFGVDITSFITKESSNTLKVQVKDTLNKKYPYGKQRKKRGGMWYTPVSGIWQSVWLENVPIAYIQDVKFTPDLEGVHVVVETTGVVPGGFKIRIPLENGEFIEKTFSEKEGYINLKDYVCEDGTKYNPRLWDTEHPNLYSVIIETAQDRVESYFALRTITIENVDGIQRVCLNHKPTFLHGVLDQGYYSDGIYLPADPQEYEKDILRMKELGFNMLRKHIKVEPECFYYYCDKHGMLVVQDMVNNGGYSFLFDTGLPTLGMKKRNDQKSMNTTRKIFKEQMKETIRHLYNHPSIVVYTIFNEGWGQFNSDEMYRAAKEIDNTRLYDSTSGWFAQELSDFDSEHIYFKTTSPEVKERPLFISECGGYSRSVEGHIYSKYASYGYGGAKDQNELTDMILHMYQEMVFPGVCKGICGCVYTQLSDVEDEVNGLYTYDRKICKVDGTRMREVAKQLYTSYNNISLLHEKQ